MTVLRSACPRQSQVVVQILILFMSISTQPILPYYYRNGMLTSIRKCAGCEVFYLISCKVDMAYITVIL